MRRKFYVLCLFCAAAIAFAGCSKDEEDVTGSIYGLVTDADNGEPIKSANVSLNPGGKSAVTGTDGRYEFLDLEPGQYTVQVVKSGYESNTKRITVEVGKTASGDVVLSKASSKLKLSTNTLNFGNNWKTLSFSISNIGTTGTISWNVSTEGLDWITVSPVSGTTATGKTSEVIVTVLRDNISGPENGIIKVSADGESLPINVTVNQEISEENNKNRYLSAAPLSINLGTKESEEFTLFSHNDATSYELFTRGIDGWLLFSEVEGTIPTYNPANETGTAEKITVFAQRDGLDAGTYTGVVIVRSDLGDLEIPVSMTVSESGNTGGNTGSVVVESPHSDLPVTLQNVVRSGSNVTLTFSIQNNSGKDLTQLKLYSSYMGVKFGAYDDLGNSYDASNVQEIKIGNKTSGGAAYEIWPQFPEGVKLVCTMTLKNVSTQAGSFTNITIPCGSQPEITTSSYKIVFKNVGL